MNIKKINCAVLIVSDNPNIEFSNFMRFMSVVNRDLTQDKDNTIATKGIEYIYYLTMWDDKTDMKSLFEEYQKFHRERNGVNIAFAKLSEYERQIKSGLALLKIYHLSDGTRTETKENLDAIIDDVYLIKTYDINVFNGAPKYDKLLYKKDGKVKERIIDGMGEIL